MNESNSDLTIAIKVIPKAAKNALVGWENKELKVRLNAVPEKGAANEELIEFLSEFLDLPKSRIELIRGATSRHKQIRLINLSSKERDRAALLLALETS